MLPCGAVINHVGGVTALWKVAATANVSSISMAPHACEGAIGGLATIQVDAAMPNFLVQEICGQVKPGLGDLSCRKRALRCIHLGAPAPWPAPFTTTARLLSGE